MMLNFYFLYLIMVHVSKRQLIIGICRSHTLEKERSSISHCRPLSEETLFSLSAVSLVYGITQTSLACIHSKHLSKDSDTSLSPIKPGILNSLSKRSFSLHSLSLHHPMTRVKRPCLQGKGIHNIFVGDWS